jgi:hypothetical protein
MTPISLTGQITMRLRPNLVSTDSQREENPRVSGRAWIMHGEPPRDGLIMTAGWICLQCAPKDATEEKAQQQGLLLLFSLHKSRMLTPPPAEMPRSDSPGLHHFCRQATASSGRQPTSIERGLDRDAISDRNEQDFLMYLCPSWYQPWMGV